MTENVTYVKTWTKEQLLDRMCEIDDELNLLEYFHGGGDDEGINQHIMNLSIEHNHLNQLYKLIAD